MASEDELVDPNKNSTVSFGMIVGLAIAGVVLVLAGIIVVVVVIVLR